MPTIEKCVQANYMYTAAVPIWQSMITNLLLQALASDVIAVATENTNSPVVFILVIKGDFIAGF